MAKPTKPKTEHEIMLIFDGDTVKIVTPTHEITMDEVRLARKLGQPDLIDLQDCCRTMKFPNGEYPFDFPWCG